MNRKNAITPLLDDRYDLPPQILRRLKTPLALTKLGMVAERASRAFWPFWTVLLVALALLAFGVQDMLPQEAVWAGAALAIVVGGWAFIRGAMRFHMPTRVEVFQRLDATLPGRPIAALSDTQALGAGDEASEAVWLAHIERMSDRAAQAKAAEPDLNLTSRDPYALRYLALTVFLIALVFGSLWRVTTVAGAVSPGGAGGPAAASGPSWEGWIEPPLYTGMPSLYLNDIDEDEFSVPVGSTVTFRLYGDEGALTVEQSVAKLENTPEETAATPKNVNTFEVTQSGEISVRGRGGQSWEITATPDDPPSIMFSGELTRTLSGEMKQPFTASDDYAVVAGRVEIGLNRDAIDRRYGLEIELERYESLVLDLPMTISGDRAAFEEVVIEDLSKHPWANLPVRMMLVAIDDKGQEGRSEVIKVILPGRRFFDPLANALIELRRDLLWNRQNLGRTIQVLRAVTYKPDDVFHDSGDYLQVRMALRRMEAAMNVGGFTFEDRDEMAEVLWEIAVRIEEGDLSDALEQLRRAQDRLSEAMKNGASQEEIDELMRELADAMQDYMRQLAEQNQDSDNQMAGNSERISGDDLRQMLEEIQRLMEEGRMAEAQALLQQLMEMMENMQVTQSEGGERSPGERSMDELSDTLRDQQELSDDSFRDLQEQFGQGQPQQGQNQPGEQGQPSQQQGQGQQGEQSSPGGQQQGQQGQSQEGQSSPGGQGRQQGMGQSEGQGGLGRGQGQGDGAIGQSLAERQNQLRRELERQKQNLPGAGTPEGDAARDSLDRAGRAMDEAEEALRNEDLSRAIDSQAEALEALREGLRNLSRSLANDSGESEGDRDRQGQAAQSGEGRRDGTDPLGRGRPDINGSPTGTTGKLLGERQQRAKELQDEIRRRAGEQERLENELEYLERLLDRF